MCDDGRMIGYGSDSQSGLGSIDKGWSESTEVPASGHRVRSRPRSNS